MRTKRAPTRKTPARKPWLILVLLSLPVLLFVALSEITPEEQAKSRVRILAAIEANRAQRRYLEAAEDTLSAQQTSGTRQPGGDAEATRAAITGALVSLEATSRALNAQLARLDSRRPTSTPELPAGPADACQVGGNASLQNELAALINAQRAANGLAPLSSNALLARAARAHSADMACRGFFSHTGPDGATAGDRIKDEGYGWSIFAENIAGGYGSPQDVLTGWMNSPGHRDNILSPRVVDIGVGYAYRSGSDRGHYWTVVFAAP